MSNKKRNIKIDRRLYRFLENIKIDTEKEQKEHREKLNEIEKDYLFCFREENDIEGIYSFEYYYEGVLILLYLQNMLRPYNKMNHEAMYQLISGINIINNITKGIYKDDKDILVLMGKSDAKKSVLNLIFCVEKSFKEGKFDSEFDELITKLSENTNKISLMKNNKSCFGAMFREGYFNTNKKIYCAFSGSSTDYHGKVVKEWNETANNNTFIDKMKEIEESLKTEFRGIFNLEFVHLTDDVCYYEYYDKKDEDKLKKYKNKLKYRYKNDEHLDVLKEKFSCVERKLLVKCNKKDRYHMIVRFVPCDKCVRSFKYEHYNGTITVPYYLTK